MSNVKYQHHILEAIDQLRGRKARPDIERICNYVQRRYNVDPQKTLTDLERLVDQETVIRVEYKGNTSYRNAAKWPRYNLYKNKPDAANIVMLNSERTSNMLMSALQKLLCRCPGYRVSGVPYAALENELVNVDDEERFEDKKYMNSILAREMNSGSILMLENGNYMLDTRPIEDEEDKKEGKNNPGKPGNSTIAVAENEKDRKRTSEPGTSEGPSAADKDEKSSATEELTGATCESAHTLTKTQPSPSTGFRVGSRRKRARKVFDPSENNIPRSRKRGNKQGGTLSNIPSPNKQLQQHVLQHQMLRMQHQQQLAARKPFSGDAKEMASSRTWEASSPSAPPPDIPPSACIICNDSVSTNKAGRLSICKGCTRKAHPACLRNLDDPTVQPLLRPGNRWRCMQCRSCTICSKNKETEWMVVCQLCDDAYHSMCHSPALNKKPSSKWICYRCTVEKALTIGQGGGSSYSDGKITPPLSMHGLNGGLPTPRESPTQEEGSSSGGDFDDQVGDVIEWTPEEVADYFRTRGFKEEADVISEQAVDGKALLLMKRLDVLKGLGLKLGPALKMYCHVRLMQQRHYGSDFSEG